MYKEGPPYEALVLQCSPCAHCACKPEVFHQDYVGDLYVGDQYLIECPVCNIGTNFDKWGIVLKSWNKKA